MNLSKEQAMQKASRCLHCANPQCSLKGCPLHTHIPDFIQAIKDDKLEDAYQILQENNVFSSICGRVCPHEKQCQGSCVLGIKGEPVDIGELETFVNDWAKEHNFVYEYNKAEPNGKNIAIVGAGPAGLECGYQLSKKGYEVDIFDKEWVPGGVMYYGIPDFRLNKSGILDEVVNKVITHNMNFERGIHSANEIEGTYGSKIVDLQRDYDAVFLSIGLAKTSSYELTDKECNSILTADRFLKIYANYVSQDAIYYASKYNGSNDNNESNDSLLDSLQNEIGKVVVIGGGNVAMDCSRVALKMGAKSSKIFYRRDKEHMPASKVELREAIEDGVEWCEKVRVISANVEEGKLKSINCIRTQIVDGKAVDIEGSEFVEECNTVIFAIGMKPDKELIQKLGLELNEWGTVKVDDNYKTNLDKVFAAGDIIGETATVANAIKSGRNAAQKIDNCLQ